MAQSERKVLIAVDASAHSKFAFEWFLENVYKPHDFIVICHIPEAPELSNFSFREGLNLPAAEWHNAIQKKVEANNKLYATYEQELITKKIKYKMVGQHHPKPGKAIVEIAQEEGVKAICLGTRGLDAIKRVFVGSVSDYVMRHSKLPIIVCPSPDDA
jgi:nucleotide-binding universal stress UspA family protein